MEFEEEIVRALVRIAKLKAEGRKFMECFEELAKSNDSYGLYMLGTIIGLLHGWNQTMYAASTIHNFHVCVERLRKGESEEKLVEELRRIEKEAERDNLMMYGG